MKGKSKAGEVRPNCVSGRSNLKYCLRSREGGRGRRIRTRASHLYGPATTTCHGPLLDMGVELHVRFADKRYFTFFLTVFSRRLDKKCSDVL